MNGEFKREQPTITLLLCRFSKKNLVKLITRTYNILGADKIITQNAFSHN